MLFDLVEVGNEIVDDFGPSFVERLVPDGGSKGGDVEGIGFGFDRTNTLIVDVFALVRDNEIHLVD